MEEIIVERTIKVLAEHLQPELLDVWLFNESELERLEIIEKKNLDIPINVSSEDFFRFGLGERVSSKNYRFIVSSQRNIADTDHRGDVANEYDLEIFFIYDFGFDEKSRYYIPMRVREAIIKAVEKHSRMITGRSSDITLSDISTVETAGKGGRSVLAGVLYKTIA